MIWFRFVATFYIWLTHVIYAYLISILYVFHAIELYRNFFFREQYVNIIPMFIEIFAEEKKNLV